MMEPGPLPPPAVVAEMEPGTSRRFGAPDVEREQFCSRGSREVSSSRAGALVFSAPTSICSAGMSRYRLGVPLFVPSR